MCWSAVYIEAAPAQMLEVARGILTLSRDMDVWALIPRAWSWADEPQARSAVLAEKHQ